MDISIAYDHQIFCIQRYGGISRYFVEIASRLQKDARFHVRIIAPLHFNAYLSNCSGYVIGRYVPPIPRTAGLRGVLNSRLAILGFKAVKPDIIHETYYGSDGCECNGSKRVVTVHDMIHEKFSCFYPKDTTAQRKALAVNRADHVICVSENTRKDLIELLEVPPEKITVIYHGSSLVPDRRNESSQPAKYPRPYILFVGKRGHYKNFHGLLRAYSQSGRLQNDFNIVCFGDDQITDEEKVLIHDLGINEECICFVNGDDRRLAEYYCNASAFVYPSFYEGFGIPLLEAMSCHCPIACSSTSCFGEIAGEAAEFFDPANIESMENAIQRIVYSSYRSKELIRLGDERVKLFSWDTASAQMADIYSALL